MSESFVVRESRPGGVALLLSTGCVHSGNGEWSISKALGWDDDEPSFDPKNPPPPGTLRPLNAAARTASRSRFLSTFKRVWRSEMATRSIRGRLVGWRGRRSSWWTRRLTPSGLDSVAVMTRQGALAGKPRFAAERHIGAAAGE